MTELIEFDAARVRKYLDGTINGFLNDPPDSQFQAGFLAAVVVICREALGRIEDSRLDLCDKMVSAAPAGNDP